MAAPSYPLTMPTNVNFKTSNWTLQRTVAYTRSPFTYEQTVHEYEGTQWTATLSLPPLSRELAAEWQVFLTQLHGRKGTFLMPEPDSKTPRGSVTNTIQVNGAHAVGAFDITIFNGDASTNLLKKGDFIQLGSAATAKLYMVTADTAADVNGAATIPIEPSLKTALSGNETVVYTNPMGVFRLSQNEISWNANEVSIYGISFAVEEAL